MKERDLSCFFAREFFWAYLENNLDKVRASQLEEHLSECTDCASLLKREKVSRKILQDLAQTQPTPEVVTFLKKEHRFWEDLSAKLGLTNSIETITWVGQLSIVAIALAVTVHFFPWLNLAQSLQNIRPVMPPISAKPNQGAPTTPSASPPGAQPFIGPKLPTDEELAAMKESPPTKTTPDEAEKKGEDAQSTEENESEIADANKKSTLESGQEHQMGFVWRGELKVEEINDEVAERVTQIITDLGGSKAGQVALGWHRDQEFYYHFILPEENYEKLLNALNAEGLVQLTKERHPRVIKSGYMRIIMTVEQDENETR